VKQPPEGSPTFAIAHEYHGRACDVIHIDLYRLRSEGELEEAGIPSYFWEREDIVICEWLSQFSDFEARVLESKRNWVVSLSFSEDLSRRSIQIKLRKN
jgi:tRNA A37 threonylcarbamoyladenosine biosynthesis protein TsaE